MTFAFYHGNLPKKMAVKSDAWVDKQIIVFTLNSSLGRRTLSDFGIAAKHTIVKHVERRILFPRVVVQQVV